MGAGVPKESRKLRNIIGGALVSLCLGYTVSAFTLYGAYVQARDEVGGYLKGHVGLVQSVAKVGFADEDMRWPRAHPPGTGPSPSLLHDLLAEAAGPLHREFQSYEGRLVLPSGDGTMELRHGTGQPPPVWEPVVRPQLGEALERALAGESGIRTMHAKDGPSVLVAFAPLAEKGGAVAISVHLAEVLSPFLWMAAVLAVASVPLFLGGLALLRLASQQMERRLDVQEARAKATLDSLTDGLITFDGKGECLTVNGAARRLLGLSADAVPSQNAVAEILKLDIARQSCVDCRHPCEGCLRLMPAARLTTLTVRNAGQDTIELEVVPTPLEVKGDRVGIIMRLVDVTEAQGVRRREAVQRRLDIALTEFKSRALTVLLLPDLIGQARQLLCSIMGSDGIALGYEDDVRKRHQWVPSPLQAVPGAAQVEAGDGKGARVVALVPVVKDFPAVYRAFAQAVVDIVLLAAARLVILEELAAREERLLEITEETGDALCRFDALGRIEFFNPAYGRLVGLDRVACLDASFFDLHGPEVKEQVAALDEGVAKSIDMRVGAEGDEKWFRWTILRVRSAEGDHHFQASGKDISELQRSREALRERERILAAVHICSSVLLAASDWRLTLPKLLAQIGPATEATRGYVYRLNREEEETPFIENLAEWTQEGFEPLVPRGFQTIPWGGGPFDRMLDQLSDGRYVKFSVAEVGEPAGSYLMQAGVKNLVAFPIMVAGNWWGLVGLERSVMRGDWSPPSLEGLQSIANALSVAIVRQKTMNKLRDSEEFAKSLMTTAPEAIIVVDAQGQFIHWNVRAAEMLGCGFDGTDAPNTDALVIPGSSLERLIGDTLKSGCVPEVPLATEAIGFDGNRIQVEVSVGLWYRTGQPLLSLIIRDIRHRIDAERQLRQAQKIEALGNLAGGIAHDFNNLLVPILALSDLLIENDDLQADVHEELGMIRSAAEQGRQLVKRILSFSRDSGHDMACLDIREVVQEALCVLRATVPTSVDVRFHPKASAMVSISKAMFHAALFNLVKNGVEAIGAKTGAIDITLRLLPAGDHLTGLGVLLDRARDHVVLTVVDSGHGMDETTLSRIFDPYFTTKGVGEGTGLGLMMVHDVVSNHGGQVFAESRLGEGTIFTIMLPVEQQHETAAA